MAARPMRLGVVGSDIIHALEYASVFRPEPGSDEAMVQVPPLRPQMEARLASVRALEEEPIPRPWTRAALDCDPAVGAVDVVGWWGADAEATAEMAARLDVPVFDRVEALADAVDAALVCTYAGSRHYALAQPLVERGRHVFVDKPFTEDPDEAADLVALGRRRGAVVFSSSPWKWAPAVQALVGRLDELGGVHSAVVTGPIVDGAWFYTAHSVELAQYVLGEGAARCSGLWTDLNYTTVIAYAGGRVAVVNGLRDVSWVRHLSVHGDLGYLEADITNAQRDEGKVQMMVEFARALQSGQPPVPDRWLVEAVAALDAADRSRMRAAAWTALARPLEDEDSQESCP